MFEDTWPNHQARDFQAVLRRRLVYIAAYQGDRLVGFVNVIGDGDVHAFLLDISVAQPYQRRGIATELIAHASRSARDAGARWLHVDFEPHLEPLYRGTGFVHTAAGLLRLDNEPQ
ncbi:MAG: GNAT family N-acetyltransferase [Myxococcota bacterium]